MLIIIEGERRSGKSTLARILSSTIPDAKVIHCTSETPNDFRFFCDIIKASQNRNIICDRFCYGQFAYQDEIERNLTLDSLHRLEVLMLDSQVSIVYCDCSPDTVRKRMLLTGKDSCNGVYRRTPEQVISGFRSILDKSILPVVKYNTDDK